MSSSRVQKTCTGPPAALETATASSTKSVMARRPKPPPRSVVWSVICSGLKPMTRSSAATAIDWPWVGAQISTVRPRTWAVQFIGSMVAWARSGSS